MSIGEDGVLFTYVLDYEGIKERGRRNKVQKIVFPELTGLVGSTFDNAIKGEGKEAGTILGLSL